MFSGKETFKTTDSNQISMENMSAGDVVISNNANKCIVESVSTNNIDTWKIMFKDDSAIVCSDDTKFLHKTNSGYRWKTLKTIMKNENLFTNDCVFSGFYGDRVVSDIFYEGKTTLYDGVVSNDGSFTLNNGVYAK